MEPAPTPAPAPAPHPFDAPEASTIRQASPVAARGWPAAALGCSGCLLWLAGMALLVVGMIDAFSRVVSLRCCAEGDRLVVVREATNVSPFGGAGNTLAALRVDEQGNGQLIGAGHAGSTIVPMGGRVFSFDDRGARVLEGGPAIECEGEILACSADGERVLALVSRERHLRLATFDGARWEDAGPVVLPGSGLAEAGAGDVAAGEEEAPEEEETGGPVGFSSTAYGSLAHDWTLLVRRGEPWLFWMDSGGLSYSARTNGEWSQARKFGSVEVYAAASDGNRVVVAYDRTSARRILGFSGLGYHVWEGGTWRFGEILREEETMGVELAAAEWNGAVAVVYGGGTRVTLAEIAEGRVRRVREVVPLSSGRVRWNLMLAGLAGMAVLSIPILWGVSRWSDGARPRDLSGEFGVARAGSLIRRGCAHGVDLLLSAGPVVGWYAWRAATAPALSERTGGSLPLDALGLAMFVYGVWLLAFEALRGTTPGKALCGLRVIALDGRGPGLRAALARNLFRVIDGVPGAYLVGAISLVLTDRSQRLGDLVSGTLVIETRGWVRRTRSPGEPA